jgi:hypothetical protein
VLTKGRRVAKRGRPPSEEQPLVCWAPASGVGLREVKRHTRMAYKDHEFQSRKFDFILKSKGSY